MSNPQKAEPVGAIADLQRRVDTLEQINSYLLDVMQQMASEMDWLDVPKPPDFGDHAPQNDKK